MKCRLILGELYTVFGLLVYEEGAGRDTMGYLEEMETMGTEGIAS